MSANDPFAPLRSLTHEQRAALIHLMWTSTATAVALTRLFDSIGIGSAASIESIVADVMGVAIEQLDGEGGAR